MAIITTKIPILVGNEFLGFAPRELKRYGFLSMAHEARTDWSMLLGTFYLLIAGAGRWSIDSTIYDNLHHADDAYESTAQ